MIVTLKSQRQKSYKSCIHIKLEHWATQLFICLSQCFSHCIAYAPNEYIFRVNENDGVKIRIEWTCDKSASSKWFAWHLFCHSKSRKIISFVCTKSATSNKYCGIEIAPTIVWEPCKNGRRLKCKRAWNECRYLRYIWFNRRPMLLVPRQLLFFCVVSSLEIPSFECDFIQVDFGSHHEKRIK